MELPAHRISNAPQVHIQWNYTATSGRGKGYQLTIRGEPEQLWYCALILGDVLVKLQVKQEPHSAGREPQLQASADVIYCENVMGSSQ